MAGETLSLPSLVIVGIILFLSVRYFLSRQSPASNSTSSASSRAASRPSQSRTRPVDLSKVEQVAQMFPQLDRHAIAWDLSRNGGNVGATTEKVLVGGGLDDAPPSFQPPNLVSPSSSNTATSTSNSTSQQQAQDLISRYKLANKLSAPATPTNEEETGKGKGKSTGWANTKTERAQLLAKRREDMILEARRKMEAKDRGVS